MPFHDLLYPIAASYLRNEFQGLLPASAWALSEFEFLEDPSPHLLLNLQLKFFCYFVSSSTIILAVGTHRV